MRVLFFTDGVTDGKFTGTIVVLVPSLGVIIKILNGFGLSSCNAEGTFDRSANVIGELFALESFVDGRINSKLVGKIFGMVDGGLDGMKVDALEIPLGVFVGICDGTII